MDALESLEVWKRSCRLSANIYSLLTKSRQYGFRDQVTRSGLSIPSNIAEGYERNSRKEFVRFLRYAKGSCGELKMQLYIRIEAGFVDDGQAKRLIREAREISCMIQGLIRRYETQR